MNRKISFILMMTIILTLASPVVWGDSLWNDDSQSLIIHNRVFHVGDLLTIIIMEQSSASQGAATNGKETSTIVTGPGSGLLREIIPHMQADMENGYQGKGQTSRNGALTARLTVTIVGTEPNGVLLVEGRQMIKVNKDNQEIFVKGKVRKDDVRADNTIVSSYIADAYIEYKGDGASGDHTKPGIITRILSWLL
jgi:flagellar L-ring protein precursor FlgH